MSAMPSTATMRRAFAEKDRAFEGLFFVAVKTTGIFCRPTCKAKTPRPENVEFFASAIEAKRQGYRACKLCKPEQTSSPSIAMVNRLRTIVEQTPPDEIDGAIRNAGFSISTARRTFLAQVGMTFSQYARSRRLGVGLQNLRKGEKVMHAQLEAGFESSSGFRQAFAKQFGSPASMSADVPVLTSAWIETPLGPMLAVTQNHRLVMLEFHDRRDMTDKLDRFRSRLGTAGAKAAIVPGDCRTLDLLRRELAAYFAGSLQTFTVPLEPCGTPFEIRAWDFLRAIPYAQTRTYGQQAAGIGSPAAARAVGRANGNNNIAIVIPCHRVIGASGTLTGYAAGLARKKWLLDHERSHAAD